MITHNVIITTGYAEDQSNAHLWMNLSSDERWSGYQIAMHLKGLLQDFVQKEMKSKMGKCCQAAPKSSKFCKDCGKFLEPLRESFDIDAEAAEVLRELSNANCDSSNHELVNHFEENGWSIWGHPVDGPFVWLSAFDCYLDPERSNELEFQTYDVAFKETTHTNFEKWNKRDT